MIVGWSFTVLHSLAYAVLPTLVLGLMFSAGAWYWGAGWHSLWAWPLSGLLVLASWWGYSLGLPTQAPARGAAVGLRVAHLNTLYYRRNFAAKLKFIATSQAEIVSLQEVNPALAAQLPTLQVAYPYQQLSQDRLAMALLSRYPLQRLQAWDERAVLYQINRPAEYGGVFYVLQWHPQSPYLPAAWQQRNARLASVTQVLGTLPRPLLVVGDFNTTPWDPALQPWRHSLQQAGGGRAWLPSFPSFLPLTPIDHLLASPEWPAAIAAWVRVAGSDHLGLVVDFDVLASR
jgi:endonuclease/exonuclease/phosphatase (EEP) superfamily protein YafD